MEQSYTPSPAVLRAFGLPDDVRTEPVSGGHINSTFLARAPQGELILQRINRFVFPSPEKVMENIAAVTEFLRKKLILSGGDPDRGTLTLHKALDGRWFTLDEAGEYWRCVSFISGTCAHLTATGPDMLREAGRAFGDFQRMLSDFPAAALHEIIPDFHNTPVRLQQLKDAAERDAAGRRRDAGPQLEFALRRECACGRLMELLGRGELPLRVTHNDTKLSNVLLDDETGRAVCVIDLDTVMPGLAAFDFGDSIRAGASTAAEDEADLSKVRFDLERFEAYTQGFLSAAGGALTEKELETLPDGAVWMTYETGIRFLADYLNGDVYFRTAYPLHNLDRAKNQFKLVEEMENARSEMDGIVRRYSHSQ